MRFALTLNAGCDKEPYDALNHSYVSFFQRLGIVPVLVPNAIGDPCSYVNFLGVQGIILTGGSDISPRLYGQDLLTCKSVSAARDRVEGRLLQMATEKNLPVLGICRGMQFINVFFGGGLIQDVRVEVGEEVDHVGHSHKNEIIDAAVGSFLGVTELSVNSFHNQGVVARVLAPALRVFAVSKGDRLIEGVLHPAYPILGIQWHPERPDSSAELDLRLIQGFLQGVFWQEREEQIR